MPKRVFSNNVDFGSCCNDLRHAMTQVPNSFLHESEDGILYMVLGYAQIRDGRAGYFDQAVIFCPFCGSKLQDRETIAAKAHSDQ